MCNVEWRDYHQLSIELNHLISDYSDCLNQEPHIIMALV